VVSGRLVQLSLDIRELTYLQGTTASVRTGQFDWVL
jgi:hypothetical protein